jgi:nitrate reductase gamma subunit
MRDLINSIVFGWYPYLCLTVFLLGSLLRFDREQYTWPASSASSASRCWRIAACSTRASD